MSYKNQCVEGPKSENMSSIGFIASLKFSIVFGVSILSSSSFLSVFFSFCSWWKPLKSESLERDGFTSYRQTSESYRSYNKQFVEGPTSDNMSSIMFLFALGVLQLLESLASIVPCKFSFVFCSWWKPLKPESLERNGFKSYRKVSEIHRKYENRRVEMSSIVLKAFFRFSIAFGVSV